MSPDADPALLDALVRARDEVVPFIGERAEALYGWRIADTAGSAAWRSEYAGRLEGEDPAHPQVTETERLLLDWAAAGPAGPDPELTERMSRAFSEALRSSLDRYALALRALAG